MKSEEILSLIGTLAYKRRVTKKDLAMKGFSRSWCKALACTFIKKSAPSVWYKAAHLVRFKAFSRVRGEKCAPDSTRKPLMQRDPNEQTKCAKTKLSTDNHSTRLRAVDVFLAKHRKVEAAVVKRAKEVQDKADHALAGLQAKIDDCKALYADLLAMRDGNSLTLKRRFDTINLAYTKKIEKFLSDIGSDTRKNNGNYLRYGRIGVDDSRAYMFWSHPGTRKAVVMLCVGRKYIHKREDQIMFDKIYDDIARRLPDDIPIDGSSLPMTTDVLVLICREQLTFVGGTIPNWHMLIDYYDTYVTKKIEDELWK